jgi:hypothetical protein
MRAVDQWEAIEEALPEGWREARLSFTVEDPKSIGAVAGVLAPLGPGRSGSEFRIQVRPSGGPAGVESLRNLLWRLDRKRIWGDLRLVDSRVEAPAARRDDDVVAQSHKALEAVALTAAWDRALASLPPDWSDALCELRVDSSDYLPRAALLGAPLNPSRRPDELALRFRVGRKGYGTSAAMARRCFERMDAEGITGSIEVVNDLSDVANAGTLGPVWRIAGRSV